MIAALPQIQPVLAAPVSAGTADVPGVGLGLAIVKTCVEACQGSLTLRNRQPRGFVAELRLVADGP